MLTTAGHLFALTRAMIRTYEHGVGFSVSCGPGLIPFTSANRYLVNESFSDGVRPGGLGLVTNPILSLYRTPRHCPKVGDAATTVGRRGEAGRSTRGGAATANSTSWPVVSRGLVSHDAQEKAHLSADSSSVYTERLNS